ncbi:MAG: apolipoprotein N-acyltransferase [Myxococcota bacterium]
MTSSEPRSAESSASPRPALLRDVALAACAGAMQFLGFAGFDVWPFAFVCFVPPLWLLERAPAMSARRTALLGLVHGYSAYAGGYYWMVTTLDAFSGYGTAAATVFASIFWLYQALQHVAFYLLVRRGRMRGWPLAVLAVAALLTVEHGFPTLFPSYLASGFHEVTPFIQSADLGGAMLVSAVVMGVNVGLHHALFRPGKTRLRPLAAAVAVAALNVAYGLYRVADVDGRAAVAPQLEVGMVQSSLPMDLKRHEPLEGYRRHVEGSLRLEDARPDLDLIVWPESGYNFFLPSDASNLRGRVMGSLRGRRAIATPMLFGGLARRPGEAGEDALFNTAYLIDEDGDRLGTYDKTYLLAFGEFMPLGDTFPILYEWSPNTGHFTPGDHVRPLVLPVEGREVRIGTLICYEDVLPGFTRRVVREGDPHLLVNITNDTWFGDTLEPWIHLALAKFRAVEHHRALARSTNSGVTAFVDPVGRTLETLSFGEIDEIATELPLLTGTTVYAVVGDWPGWMGLGLTFWLVLVGRRRDDEGPASGEVEA